MILLWQSYSRPLLNVRNAGRMIILQWGAVLRTCGRAHSGVGKRGTVDSFSLASTPITIPYSKSRTLRQLSLDGTVPHDHHHLQQLLSGAPNHLHRRLRQHDRLRGGLQRHAHHQPGRRHRQCPQQGARANRSDTEPRIAKIVYFMTSG